MSVENLTLETNHVGRVGWALAATEGAYQLYKQRSYPRRQFARGLAVVVFDRLMTDRTQGVWLVQGGGAK
jgi:hypothetical protein